MVKRVLFWFAIFAIYMLGARQYGASDWRYWAMAVAVGMVYLVGKVEGFEEGERQ